MIVPAENKKDYEELPDFIRKGIEPLFVSHYDEVFAILFPNDPTTPVSKNSPLDNSGVGVERLV